jgi:hypothetical protein
MRPILTPIVEFNGLLVFMLNKSMKPLIRNPHVL